MHIKDIKKLPIYKQMCPREMWKNTHVNNGFTKQSTGSSDLMSDKGSGWIYIIRNTELKGWFKVGCTKNSTQSKRMQSIKSVIPVGEWETVYWEYCENIAFEELKLKQFYRFECEYRMGIYSKEWFYGDWEVIKNIDTLKNEINYIQKKHFTKRYKLKTNLVN
jgi:hypothetical protein